MSFYQVSRVLPKRWKWRIKRSLGVPDMEATLLHMKNLGYVPDTVIDIGAYRGDWTRMCKRVFPHARVLMVEPQRDQLRDLERVRLTLQGVEMVNELLGAIPLPSVSLLGSGTGASVLREHGKASREARLLPMKTFDEVASNTEFALPDFIKLDVQGYELEILKGAEKTLASVEALVMEVSLIDVYENAPTFAEVVEFMDSRGFHVYDFCSFIRRPRDAALWQVDAVFVRSNSSLLASRSWA